LIIFFIRLASVLRHELLIFNPLPLFHVFKFNLDIILSSNVGLLLSANSQRSFLNHSSFLSSSFRFIHCDPILRRQ
jgi:hypothetical protein